MKLRRFLLRSGLALLAGLFAIQLVPYGRAHRNPLPVREPAWDSPETRALAKGACFDCHSNETEWPMYARLAPASWLIQRDVVEGREALNFSEWQRAQKDADEAADKVIEGDMPPIAYSLMHSHGRLTDAQRARLAEGLDRTIRQHDANDADEHRGRR